MRRAPIGLGFILATTLGLGCGGGRTKALAMLPHDTQVVVGIDFTRARGTDVWAAGEELVGTFAKEEGFEEAFEKVEDWLEELESATDLDLVNELDSVVAGFVEPEDGGKPLFVLIATTTKKLDEDSLFDFLEEAGEDDGEPMEKDEVKGVNVYRSDSGEASSFLWDAKTFVLGSSDLVDEVVELKAGKGKSALDDPELAAAVKKVDGAAALWFAAAVTDEMEDGLKKFPMEGIDDAKDFSGSVVFGKDVRTTVKVGFDKKEDAADVADTAAAFLKVGKKKLKEKADELAWSKPLLDAYTIEAEGKDVVAKLVIDEDVLAGAVKWAKKDGKGLAGLLLMGAFAKKKDAKLDVDPDASFASAKIAPAAAPKTATAGLGSARWSDAPAGACARYAACTTAMGAAYRKAGVPDAAKSMEEVGAMMAGMSGPSAESSCSMALESIAKSADLYEKMPKFEFPRDECR